MTCQVDCEFGIDVCVEADGAVVAVRGELDIATAPALAAVLDDLVNGGHRRIVLDLGELCFLDASGIRVFCRILNRLRAAEGEFAIGPASAPVTRVLDLTGFSGVLSAVSGASASSRLGAEEPADDVEDADADRTERDGVRSPLAHINFGALPATNETLDATLRLVVALAGATVAGANGASVSLHRHGRLLTAAASDDTVYNMDQSQYETGEGPCLAAAAEGHWFHVEALSKETRWPEFTPRAARAGISSILSSPLLARGRPIGALNIYSRAEGAFGPAEQELAALFATHVSGILVDAGADVPEQEAIGRIRRALESRRDIARAEGMVMERDQVSAAEAAAILQSSARAAKRTVLDQAAVILGLARADDPGTPSNAEGPATPSGVHQ